MDRSDRRDRQTGALRERVSRLSEASLRINESLDLDAALWAVMEGARSLTGASHAVITTLDARGRVDDHRALGLDPGDLEPLWQTAGGLEFFQYLNALPGPLRVGRLEEFTASIGLAGFPRPCPSPTSCRPWCSTRARGPQLPGRSGQPER